MALLLCVGICLVAMAHGQPGMVPRTVPQDTADHYGAKCLNGASPQYLIRRNTSSTKYILFLEGGGWCNGPTEKATIDSCAARAGYGGFTAPKTTSDYGGVLSNNETTNPGFYTWNAAFLHYCDGASFGGARVDSIPIKTKTGTKPLWLRGRNNFNALIADLKATQGMASATEIILSGGSAGGLAVFYNIDHLASLLPSSTRLTGFPDAGFFLDAPNVDGQYVYRQNFIGADPVWNVTAGGGTNLECLAANSGSEWKCLMAQYLTQYIKTPMFVMNSLYDAYQTSHILETKCIPTPTNACNDTDLQNYRDQFVEASKVITTSNPSNGMYLSGCFVHEQNVNYCSNQGVPNCVGWDPRESGSIKWGYKTAVQDSSGKQWTPQQAFTAYYYNREAAVLVDEMRFPKNPTCHYLGHPV